MKKIILGISLLVAAGMAVTSCEPKGFEPSKDGKVTAIGVTEATYNSTTKRMEITLPASLDVMPLTVRVWPDNAKNKRVTLVNKHPEYMEATTEIYGPDASITRKTNEAATDTLTVSATDGSGVYIDYIVKIQKKK
jgi:hypothetical protein